MNRTYLPIYNDPSIKNHRLHGPGPSPVYPEVNEAISKPTLGHLNPEFVRLMDDPDIDNVQYHLRNLFRSKNAFVLPMTGSGSIGIETLVSNLVEPDENVLVLRNGVFGKRITEFIEDKYGDKGVKVHPIDLEWGETLTPIELDKHLRKAKTQEINYDSLWLVHAETSTGALQGNLETLSSLYHSYSPNGLFMVDTVTSLGGIPINFDKNGIDGAGSGTQKNLSNPTGMAPLALSERALSKLDNRESPIPDWSLNLKKVRAYWTDGDMSRVYHTTAMTNNIYGLHAVGRLLEDEGLEKVYQRHQDASDILTKGLLDMGFRYLVEDPNKRLPNLHAVFTPEGINPHELRKLMLNDHNTEIGPALGSLKDDAIRIGVMGHGARMSNSSYLTEKLGESIHKLQTAI